MSDWQLIHGDCLDVLRDLAPGAADAECGMDLV